MLVFLYDHMWVKFKQLEHEYVVRGNDTVNEHRAVVNKSVYAPPYSY